jgi:hypothetical protein
VVIGFVLFLIWAFPGFMSTDSQVQLLEARSGKFSNAHPPLMSAYWRLLDAIISGPVLMLLLQGALFLGGLFGILKRVMAPRAAAIAAIAILMFPPVLTTMGVIWKDSQMAAFLLAGVACLLDERLKIRFVGLALLVVACSLRHNAFAAVVPLVFFLFEWRTKTRWWKRSLIGLGAAVFAVGAMFAVSKILTVQPAKITPAFQDIVGVLAFTDEEKSDAELRETLRGVPLVVDTNIQAQCRKLYALRGAWRITQGDDKLMNNPVTPAEWDALSRAWIDLVLDDPGAYLAYHWVTFRELLGVDRLPRAPVYALFVEEEGAIAELRHSAWYSTAQWYGVKVLFILAETTPLFRPWLYAVIGLALLVLCVRDRLTAAIMASGYLYELSYFPFAAEPDYRYSHWMITTVVIAGVILFVQRLRKRSA